MKIGIQKIQDIIYLQLKQANANIPIGRAKFAKDLAKRIYSELEEDMQGDLKVIAMAKGWTEEDTKLCDYVCKAFGFDVMPMTDGALEVYRWVKEQEAQGQTLADFVSWAKANEDGKFIRMYRKDPSNIRIDWPRAFSTVKGGGYDEVLI